MTATGTIIGTPTFLAPEQVSGGELSPATDIYSLAVVLYRLLVGESPYPPGTDSVAQLFQHVHEPARPLRSLRPDVDQTIADVVHRALDKDPGQRPATAERFVVELAAATRACLRGLPQLDPGATAIAEPSTASWPVGRSGEAPTTVIRAAAPPSGRRRPVHLALIAAVVGLAVVGVAALTANLTGDDTSPPAAGSGSATEETASADDLSSGEVAPLTQAELDRFIAACVAGGVTEQLCGCVAVWPTGSIPSSSPATSGRVSR